MRGAPWKRWIVVLVTLAVLVALVARRSGCSHRPRRLQAQPVHTAERASVAAPGEVGASLRGFIFKDISGHEVSSEKLRGKILLVDFWASWCAPCKVEMPGYQDLQNRYGDRGLVVIGIALDADPATVVRFAREHRIHYTLTLSSPEVQDKFGGILGSPTTILVNRHGVIRKKVIGFEYQEAFGSAVKEIL